MAYRKRKYSVKSNFAGGSRLTSATLQARLQNEPSNTDGIYDVGGKSNFRIEPENEETFAEV